MTLGFALLVLAIIGLFGCDGLGGGTRETKVTITGPDVKCVTVDGRKNITLDCPDTVTPAPVIVPPVVVAPTAQ